MRILLLICLSMTWISAVKTPAKPLVHIELQDATAAATAEKLAAAFAARVVNRSTYAGTLTLTMDVPEVTSLAPWISMLTEKKLTLVKEADGSFALRDNAAKPGAAGKPNTDHK